MVKEKKYVSRLLFYWSSLCVYLSSLKSLFPFVLGLFPSNTFTPSILYGTLSAPVATTKIAGIWISSLVSQEEMNADCLAENFE